MNDHFMFARKAGGGFLRQTWHWSAGVEIQGENCGSGCDVCSVCLGRNLKQSQEQSSCFDRITPLTRGGLGHGPRK